MKLAETQAIQITEPSLKQPYISVIYEVTNEWSQVWNTAIAAVSRTPATDLA